MSKSVRRLANGFRPDNYELSIKLLPATMLFNGTVVISGRKTGRPSQRLTLHQRNLKILSAESPGMTNMVMKSLPSAGSTCTNHSTKSVFIPISCYIREPIPSRLTFSGHITRPMTGIYPCNFEAKGQPKFLLATQFESHFARAKHSLVLMNRKLRRNLTYAYRPVRRRIDSQYAG